MISIDEFKRTYTLEQRLNMSYSVKQKYKGRIPIFVEKSPKSSLKDLKKQKFLVQTYVTFGIFINAIRLNLDLKPDHAIFLFVNNTSIPRASDLMSKISKNNCDEDGFLYITYMEENAFG